MYVHVLPVHINTCTCTTYMYTCKVHMTCMMYVCSMYVVCTGTGTGTCKLYMYVNKLHTGGTVRVY